MSLGSSSPPSAPNYGSGQSLIDPYGLATQQQNFNISTGLMNYLGSQPNVNTPMYSQGYQQVGTGPNGIPLYGLQQQWNHDNNDYIGNNYDYYLAGQRGASAMVPYLQQTGQGLIAQAQSPLTNAQGYQSQASIDLNQGMDTLNGMAHPWLTSGSGNVGQASALAGQYQAQNPKAIGDMSSGLTGQRMNAYMAGIQPFQQSNRDQLDNQLRNQGLHPGMPGYDTAMRQLDNSQTLANNTAAAQFQPQAWQQATQIYNDPVSKMQAQLAAGQGWQGLGQGAINLGNAQAGVGSQYGALSNAATNLGQTYGNLGSNLMSQALPWLAASAPGMPPTPSPAPLNIQPTNLAGLGSAYNQALTTNYGNQLSQFNAQQQQQQNMMSGLFGIGGNLLGGLASGGLLCERRFKENIEPVGALPNGIKLYSFNYKWGGPTIIGPMVDEVEKIMPEAVWLLDGYKLVDYRMVMHAQS